jgi:hypothetical protein
MHKAAAAIVKADPPLSFFMEEEGALLVQKQPIDPV